MELSKMSHFESREITAKPNKANTEKYEGIYKEYKLLSEFFCKFKGLK